MPAHAQNIFDRDVGEKCFVTWSEDKSGTEGVDKFLNFAIHLGRGAVLEEILGVHAAHEGDPTVEQGGEALRFHSTGPGLQRVQAVHSRGNEIFNDV